MKEITRVFTVELTQVSNFKNENEVLKADEAKYLLKTSIEGRFDFDNVNVVKCQDFIMEKNTKPKLTKREKEFCEFMKCGWIARDESGSLYWFNSKPRKTGTCWDNIHVEYFCMDLLNTPFAFIQWEDDEPWDVSKLRKLEVEE